MGNSSSSSGWPSHTNYNCQDLPTCQTPSVHPGHGEGGEKRLNQIFISDLTDINDTLHTNPGASGIPEISRGAAVGATAFSSSPLLERCLMPLIEGHHADLLGALTNLRIVKPPPASLSAWSPDSQLHHSLLPAPKTTALAPSCLKIIAAPDGLFAHDSGRQSSSEVPRDNAR